MTFEQTTRRNGAHSAADELMRRDSPKAVTTKEWKHVEMGQNSKHVQSTSKRLVDIGASMLSGETITLPGKSDVMWALKPGEIEDVEKWREN